MDYIYILDLYPNQNKSLGFENLYNKNNDFEFDRLISAINNLRSIYKKLNLKYLEKKNYHQM